MRCLYVDLDGTLLGRGASLLHDGEGAFTLSGVRAIEACSRAGVEVVIYSGRRKAQVFEDARLIGAGAYIYEVGAGLVIDGEEEFLTDDLQPGERTIHDQIDDSGAPALLLERYAGRLEYHEPWHTDRKISHLFRGNVDLEDVGRTLGEAGLGHVRLVDNGALHRRGSPTLPDVEGLHAYHLIPAGASKARAVARHMQARGYAAEDCIAVGDSREDMEAAEVVGTFWLVANAIERDPTLREAIRGRSNVRVAEERHGAGVYEAVVTTLAERR
jgi:hydroxymethylpyrimidine pyrophosphatase-like HAD family hydrolase